MKTISFSNEEVLALIELCEERVRHDPEDRTTYSALRSLLEARYG